MNASVWWLYCETEEDKKWYRRHIIKKTEVVQWISDNQGHVSESPEERLIRLEEAASKGSKELNTDILGGLLKNLSELDQKIVRLRHGEGLKWQAISAQLGYNLSYLWKREKRAMEKLRAIIERDDLSPWRRDD